MVVAPGQGRSSWVSRGRRRAFKLTGFALSMLLLAVASLVIIPSMIAASGPTAWGRIASGQSVGAVAAVIIAFGWGMSGPARIAKATPAERLNQYAESLIAKLSLSLPAFAISFGIAYIIGGDYRVFSGLGALSTASVGLTANWYFVGLSQPYVLLIVETVPRVLGTAIGIALMVYGGSALSGIAMQLFGMVGAFVFSTLWILHRPENVRRINCRSLWLILGEQRHGVISSVTGTAYISAPIVIVGLVAPSALPVYAIIDKVQRQVTAATTPYVTVLQGWVPRPASIQQIMKRVRTALLVTAGLGIALVALLLVIAPPLLHWLGGAQVHPPLVAIILMGCITSARIFEAVTSKACLASLERLDIVARATTLSSVVGLIVTGLWAWLGGSTGALSAVLLGLVLRMLLELSGLRQANSKTFKTPTARPDEL